MLGVIKQKAGGSHDLDAFASGDEFVVGGAAKDSDGV